MESLTLSDAQALKRQHCSDQHYFTEKRHHSPRLPTPEDSRTSSDAFDGRSPAEMRSRPQSDIFQTGILDIPPVSSGVRRDSQNIAMPHSPPYHFLDGQKPSLPPLRTILRGSMNSPPRTPSPNEAPVQPSPREPSYTASTYKPPALYPNKKARTESSMNSAIPYPVLGSLHAPLPPTTALETRTPNSITRSDIKFPPLSVPVDTIDTRRTSNPIRTIPWGAQCTPSGTTSAMPLSTSEAAANHYQTPEQTPISSMLEPSFPKISTFSGHVQDPFARETRESLSQSSEYPASRRSSTNSCGIHSVRPHDREILRPGPYQQSMRYDHAILRDQPRFGRTDDHLRAHYGPTPCTSSGTAFFMPSHYEYQYGKARKRSNLPKQSTEIMKTWFDQNIANPYPSEEQKAIFSNATGISMTQVSNWFINHRRRCPELRDKREKNRTGSDC